MKSDLSKVKVGDKIWTIQEGWTNVKKIDGDSEYPIQTTQIEEYTINGKLYSDDKYPSAFLECPFKEEPIEKDTLVWFRGSAAENWMVGYYSHSENESHYCFDYSKKSTETIGVSQWNIVKTENPLI